jgi:hypothetical protein
MEALGPEDLPSYFKEKYKDVLSLSRGGGYWIWKSALIGMTLDLMNEGDFLVYIDAGCQLNKAGEPRFREYLQMIQESPYDVIGFQLDQPEDRYTTEAIFQALNVTKNDPIRKSVQMVGGVLILQKGNHLRQWLSKLNQISERDRWLITDKYNDQAKKANPEFIDNRHDQSISSVTRKQLGCVLLPDETWPPNQAQYPIWASRIRE